MPALRSAIFLRMARTSEELGAGVLVGIALRNLGDIHATTIYDEVSGEENRVRAEECFRESLKLLNDIGNEAELGRSLSSYGNYLLEQGQFEQGRKRLEMASRIFKRMEMRKILAKTQELIEEL